MSPLHSFLLLLPTFFTLLLAAYRCTKDRELASQLRAGGRRRI